MFDTDSVVTKDNVSSAVNEMIRSCTGQESICGNLAISSASAKSTCDLDACDSTTSECVEIDGFTQCNCLPGFIQQEYARLCSVCPIHSKEENGTCVKCQSPASGYNCMSCPDGYKNENGTCRMCPFGYNGKNCEDGSLLALVIVAVCCGVLILALGITLIVTNIRKRKGKGYSDDGDDATPTFGYLHMKKKAKVEDMDSNSPSALYDLYTAIPRVTAKITSESFNHAQNSSRYEPEDDDSDNKTSSTGHTNVAANNAHDTYY
uniref:Protein HEG homolog 1-like n=1 Tax=Petromyzon marinus TaxID=7757 RepID=A0AAJ7SMF7_PETMA|nr:protein HEG homolog 1-like [Petromyzon marinus]